MVNLAKQKRIAAQVLKVGVGRVWIDPDAATDVNAAITRADIRSLIEEGTIKKLEKRGCSRGRARVRADQRFKGRQTGHGSRKGAKGSIVSRKQRWITKIRALRKRLRELREDGSVDTTTYRMLYNKANGGVFRSVAHLNDYITANELRLKGV